MKSKKTSIIDRLKNDFNEKIGDKSILDWSHFFFKNDSRAFNVTHAGTLFKLYSLYTYLIFPYLPIMTNQRNMHGTKLIYFDLFAGNGLNFLNVEHKSLHLLGSTLFVILASYKLGLIKNKNYNFDKLIIIDKDENNVDLLTKRLQLLIKELNLLDLYKISKKFDVNFNIYGLKGDVTKSDFIEELTDYLDTVWHFHRIIHIMFFIDPDTPESLRARTLQSLLCYPGDVILLLHPGIFAEMVNKRFYGKGTLKKMLDLNDDEVEKLYNNSHTPSTLHHYYVYKYENIIKNITIKGINSGSNKRDVLKKVDIKTRSGYYVLLYATRSTGGSNYERWQKGAEELATEISHLSNSGKSIINILLGEQQQISRFFVD